MRTEEFQPKYTLRDKKKFADERERLGFLITKGMKVSGGTDIDWVIEHRGGFIIIENKTFLKNSIYIPIGQMITLEQMYKKLNADGKCHMFVFGFEHDTDYKNPESLGWYFTMQEWLSKERFLLKRVSPSKYGSYGIQKRDMTKITLDEYRELMDVIWQEFEIPQKKDKASKTLEPHTSKKKMDSKPKSQGTTKKKPNYQKIEAQKKHPNAYERWTKSDDEFLKKLWSDKSKKNSNEKIQKLMQKFGRNRGAIVSRLNKMGLDTENFR